jgi:Trp operon repressor
VGTESRLRVLIDLLRDIGHGGSTSREERLANLLDRKRVIQDEIEELEEGHITPMTETEIKERFLHFQSLSRELLADFKEVEQNFRSLDHAVRERITRWDGAKADLVEEILGERDAISDSDQGRSFSAFYKLLMNTEQQDELQRILQQILEFDAVRNLAPGRRSRRVIDDWLTAATNTQRMIARLSKQLRRFIDEETRHQDRRVLQIIKGIERQIYEIADKTEAEGMALFIGGADINLPLDRPLFRQGASAQVQPTDLVEAQDEDAATDIRPVKAVDPLVLTARLDDMLNRERLTSLQRVLAQHPPELGLAELLHYIHISEVRPEYDVIDDTDVDEPIDWTIEHEGTQHERRAHLHRLIIGRKEARE